MAKEPNPFLEDVNLRDWKIPPEEQLQRDFLAREVKDAEFEAGLYPDEATYLKEKKFDDKRIKKLQDRILTEPPVENKIATKSLTPVNTNLNPFLEDIRIEDMFSANPFMEGTEADTYMLPQEVNPFDDQFTPTYGQLFRHGFRSTLGSLERAGSLAAAGLGSASTVAQLNKEAEAMEDPEGSGISKASQIYLQDLPFSKKAAMFAGSVAPLVPGYLFGMIPGVAMTVATGIGRKAKEVSEGADPTAAGVALATTVPIDALADALPFKAGTIARAAFTGGASNVVSGVVSDAINKGIYIGFGDKTSANYDPLDFEQRVLEGVFGSAMGAGGKAVEQHIYKKNLNTNLKNLFDTSLDKLQNEIDTIKHFSSGASKYDFSVYRDMALAQVPQGQSQTAMELADSAWKFIMHDLHNNQFKDSSGNPISPAEKTRVLLEFVRDGYKGVPGKEKAASQANFLLSLYKWLDLDTVDVQIDPNPNNIGAFDSLTDILTLTDRYIPRPYDVLHELNHAILFRIVDGVIYNSLGRANKLNPKTKIGSEITDTVLNIKKLYDDFLPELQKKANKANNDETYGLTNIHEFIAELQNVPDFQNLLKKVKVDASYVNQMAEKAKASPSLRGVFGDTSTQAAIHLNSDTNLHALATSLLANLIYDTTHIGSMGNSTPHNKSQSRTQDIANILQSDRDAQSIISRVVTAKDNDAKFSDNFADWMVRKVGQLVNNSLSYEIFQKKLLAQFNGPKWVDFVNKNSVSIWNNKALFDRFYKDFIVEAGNQNKYEMAGDPRMISAIFDSIFKNKMPDISDDITKSGTNFYGADTLSLIKDQTRGGRFIKAFNDKVREYVSYKSQFYKIAMTFQDKFFKLPVNSQIRVMDVSFDFNSQGQRDMLKRLGLWWPTDAMLAKQGLNAAEVEAYKQMADGYTYLYELLDAAAKADVRGLNRDGNFSLARTPGYMPHLHDGVVKVFFKVVDPTGATPDLMFIRGFNTVARASSYAKQLRDLKNPNIFLVTQQVPGRGAQDYTIQKNRSPALGITPTLVQHYQTWQDMARLDSKTAQVISDLDTIAARSWTKSLMQNHNVGGFIGDKANPYGQAMKAHFGMFPNRAAVEAFAIYQRYARSVAEFAGNSFFVQDVYVPAIQHRSPSYPEGFGQYISEMKNVVEYIENQTRNFTGENINKLNWLDEMAETAGVKLGTNPWILKSFVRFSRDLISTIRLRNPRNWWANIQSPLNSIGILYHFAQTNDLVPINKSKEYDPMRSLIWAYKELTFKESSEGKFVLDWARSKHHVDAQQDEEVGTRQFISGVKNVVNKVLLGNVNPAVEGFGREATFLASYHYLKQFYNNKMDALEAAGRAVGTVMVNYNRAARPHMFQNFGVLGESVSPFAVYRNHYIGNTWLAIRDVIRDPSNWKAWRPLVFSQATFFLTAGAVGIVGVQEYDLLVEYWNKYTPEEAHLPRFTELLIKVGAPDWIMFGTASELTKSIPITPDGVYIGASGSGPSMAGSLEPVLFPLMQSLLVFGIIPYEEGKRLLDAGPGMDMNLFYEQMKTLTPPQMHPWIEQNLVTDNGIIPRATKREGYIDGDDQNVWSRMLFGAESIPVYKEKRIEEAINRKMKSINTVINSYVEKAADFALKIPRGMETQEAFEKAVRVNPLLSREEFAERVEKEIERRLTSVRTRDYKTDSDSARYKEYLRKQYER